MNHRFCDRDFTVMISPKGDKIFKVGGTEPYFPPTGGSERWGTAAVNITSTFPFPIASLKQLLMCNAYSLYLTTDGRIFGSGSNQFGQLGVENKNLHTQQIIEIPFPVADEKQKQIKMISGGICGSTFVLTEDGVVYTCGEFNGRPGKINNVCRAFMTC
jgi:alpha-tubulin suppressor-like RCC1 family protein